jgi:hypothetical protein
VSIWIALALWAAEVVVIAALATTRRGARAGVWLGIALLPLPAFVQRDWWPPLAVLEVLLLFAMFRAADLASDGRWRRSGGGSATWSRCRIRAASCAACRGASTGGRC